MQARVAAHAREGVAAHHRRPREQPAGSRCQFPARRVHRDHRRERIGQEHARQRHPLQAAGEGVVPGHRSAGRSRSDRRPAAHRQGHPDRPVADRPDAAQQPGHLHRAVHVHPRSVRDAARVAAARLQAGPLLVQRQGRPLRGLPGRWRDGDRDALPARRVRHVRAVQGPSLQPRDARGAVPRQVDCRPARTDRGPGLPAARELSRRLPTSCGPCSRWGSAISNWGSPPRR